MITRTAIALSIAAWALTSATASSQSLITEATVSAGTSTDHVTAAGTQLRAFGDAPLRSRYFVETAWATDRQRASDAFGGAYPYRNRVQVTEAYGEWLADAKVLVGPRVGRYRVPFGISSGSEHAYNGFLRAPLIRYDGYFALSNNFLEHGVDVLVGVPRFTVEASLGVPADIGDAIRRPGLDTVIRLQSAVSDAIVGVSHIRTQPYQPARYATGNTVFTGVDVRWMRDGVQLRGEWLGGQPFAGTTTTGWYADAIVHRPRMGPITALAHLEQLDYNTVPQRTLHSKRQTLGARIRVFRGVSAQLNVMRHTGLLHQPRRTAVDAGISYSVRR
jgi:hypothetical protein